MKIELMFPAAVFLLLLCSTVSIIYKLLASSTLMFPATVFFCRVLLFRSHTDRFFGAESENIQVSRFQVVGILVLSIILLLLDAEQTNPYVLQFNSSDFKRFFLLSVSWRAVGIYANIRPSGCLETIVVGCCWVTKTAPEYFFICSLLRSSSQSRPYLPQLLSFIIIHTGFLIF